MTIYIVHTYRRFLLSGGWNLASGRNTILSYATWDKLRCTRVHQVATKHVKTLCTCVRTCTLERRKAGGNEPSIAQNITPLTGREREPSVFTMQHVTTVPHMPKTVF